VNKRKKAGISRDADHPKAPSAQDWKNAAKTAKNEDVEQIKEAKATMCGRCGTKHVHPSKGGKCPALSEAKEKTEYDYEGDMARGQLQSIINNARRVHDMLKDNDNLPEWVQSKITLAEDYISTVSNYMQSEVDEPDTMKEHTEQEIDMKSLTQIISEAETKIHPDAIHVKPVKVNGEQKYHVHAVGSNFADGIKVGEHLSDSELDDASEMGGRIKHVK
jgi:hypothetical protein